ncbi:polysaccharide deacetylase family protein [bacterium]|nr:polysaccharide deacetylase family protein [bacterium]MBU1985573.1 polysaccharide deacetylase family protein [bacterium]
MLLPVANSLQRLWTSHVLLYHSTFARVPDRLRQGLHNVTPEQLYRQIRWLKRHFDIVSVDDFFRRYRTGRVAITFDDAYTCVFTEAAAVLESLKVPFTVFVNGCSLEGKAFWRDKIRFLINRGLVAKFLDFLAPLADDARLMTVENFYRVTKDPRVSSRRLDLHVDRFLEQENIRFEEMSFCVNDSSLLRTNPLCTLGSHTYHHYVLSSLTDDEQENDIRRNLQLLQGLNVPLSRVFSIPFGGDEDFNSVTLRLIRKYGYEGFLYSRNRLNSRKLLQIPVNAEFLPAAERYMVEPEYNRFHFHLFKLAVKSVLRR